MSLSLSNLKPSPGSRTRSKRVGRGNASGRGTTAGRGTKGQRARTGGRNKLARMGARRLILSTPKLGGFKSIYSKPQIVNIEDIDVQFENGATVTPQALLKAGLVRDARHGVKILGDGFLTKKLAIKGCSLSESAKKKIVEAGGEVK